MSFKIAGESPNNEAILKLVKDASGGVDLRAAASEAGLTNGNYCTILKITADGQLRLCTGVTAPCVNGLRLNYNGRAIVFDIAGTQLLG